MGIRAGQRFYAYNVLEELDAPGEWYLDRQKGLLYFYPPSQVQGADVRFSVLSTPLITLDGVSHVTLRRLTLEGGRGTGVTVTGSDHCLLVADTVRRLGGDAVIVGGGSDDGILGCDLYTLGRGGVRSSAATQDADTGGHFVENCDIHDFSRLDRTYTPAVQIEGDGNRIAHCRLHDAPHHAIRLEGNDHVIEFNEVDHVVLEADDQGGFDEWANPSYRGNVLRYNNWHDIGSGLTAVGPGGHPAGRRHQRHADLRQRVRALLRRQLRRRPDERRQGQLDRQQPVCGLPHRRQRRLLGRRRLGQVHAPARHDGKSDPDGGRPQPALQHPLPRVGSSGGGRRRQPRLAQHGRPQPPVPEWQRFVARRRRQLPDGRPHGRRAAVMDGLRAHLCLGNGLVSHR